MKRVFFESEGAKCRIPEHPRECKRLPAIVLGHGFGIRKESLIDEAEYLTKAGFVTLAFEYRSLGESEGEPRGSVLPLGQVEDFRNAISFVQRRAEVDPERIGIWGASFGGGVVIRTASVDRRVKCVVAMAPIVNGRRWLDGVWGGGRFHKLREIIEADREKRFDGEPGGHLVIGADDLPAVLPARRARRPAERPLDGRTRPAAARRHRPDQHPVDREVIPLACEQMEVYPPPWQTKALEHAHAWFKEHL